MPKLTEEEIALQRAGNARVLELMDECGADPDKSYTLEHFIYAPTPESAQAIEAEAVATGYAASPLRETDYSGQKTWFLFLTKDALPREHDVDDATVFLLSLCNKHGAIYDGWGAGIPPDGEEFGEDGDLLEDIDLPE